MKAKLTMRDILAGSKLYGENYRVSDRYEPTSFRLVDVWEGLSALYLSMTPTQMESYLNCFKGDTFFHVAFDAMTWGVVKVDGRPVFLDTVMFRRK